jgi:chitinase
MYDGNNINKTMIASWRQTGKFVLLSVGGPNNLWNNAFSSESNRQNFVNSLANLVNISDFDGVDLDIEAYFTTAPRNVANTIKDLRVLFNKFKGKRWITLTADCIGVYQGAPVPSPDDTKIQAFNFVVPIIQLADDAIDYYNSKAYSNWYDGYNHTAVEYIQDIYLNWRNLPGMCQGCRPIANFKGVDGAKILIGLLASPDARTAAEYGGPNLVKNTKAWLLKQGYKVAGFQLWNSYFDKANGYQVSTTIIGG